MQAAYCQIPEEINLYPQISGNSISSEIKILDKDGNLDYISGKVRPRLIVYEPEGHSECGIIPYYYKMGYITDYDNKNCKYLVGNKKCSKDNLQVVTDRDFII